MSSQANKDQFLKQFEHIVDGIKNSKAKVSSMKRKDTADNVNCTLVRSARPTICCCCSCAWMSHDNSQYLVWKTKPSEQFYVVFTGVIVQCLSEMIWENPFQHSIRLRKKWSPLMKETSWDREKLTHRCTWNCTDAGTLARSCRQHRISFAYLTLFRKAH